MRRELTNVIHFVLDDLLPPVIRDSAWCSRLLSWLAYRPVHERFLTFKAAAPSMTPEEFRKAYEDTAPFFVQRSTDLTQACIDRLCESIRGTEVLDVGCGSGHFLKVLTARRPELVLTGVDIAVPRLEDAPAIRLVTSRVETLPFPDRAFDTVVCSHTLEHVQDLPHAIAELRRVCRHKLLVVVPRQRPYRFTFDFHLHFFPSPAALLIALRPLPPRARCEEIGRDLFYVEDKD